MASDGSPVNDPPGLAGHPFRSTLWNSASRGSFLRGARGGFLFRAATAQASVEVPGNLRGVDAPGSDDDALDLVDSHRVRRPVVELRRLGRRVPGDLLGVLEGTPRSTDTP